MAIMKSFVDVFCCNGYENFQSTRQRNHLQFCYTRFKCMALHNNIQDLHNNSCMFWKMLLFDKKQI